MHGQRASKHNKATPSMAWYRCEAALIHHQEGPGAARGQINLQPLATHVQRQLQVLHRLIQQLDTKLDVPVGRRHCDVVGCCCCCDLPGCAAGDLLRGKRSWRVLGR